MSGNYVKVLYDFATTESSDLSLEVNDVVKIIDVIDDDWLSGMCNGRLGNFPQNYVEAINLPAIQSEERIFVAIKNFPAEMHEDLALTKGDFIVGTELIDENWWKGTKGWKSGIFPLTHVYQLEPAQVPYVDAPQVSTNATNKSGYLAQCRATMDLTAQVDGELSFNAGDIISVTEVIDSDFAIGLCHGNTGQFPIGFVEVLEGQLECINDTGKRKSKFRWWEEEDGSRMEPSENTPNLSRHVEHPVDSIRSTASPSGNTQDRSALLRSNSRHRASPMTSAAGLSDVTEECFEEHQRGNSYTSENTRSHDNSLIAYGKTLYPFTAENSNELSFLDSEIIILLRHVDDSWMEGEVDGRKGIFPAAFVEIIVDCPWDNTSSVGPVATDDSLDDATAPDGSCEDVGPIGPAVHECSTEESATVEVVSSTEPEVLFAEDIYGLVLFDFCGDTSEALQINEGDTVTLLSRIDTYWYRAKHDNGLIGLCPVEYVQVLGAEPETPPAVNDATVITKEANNNISTNSDIVDRPVVPLEEQIVLQSISEKPKLATKPALKPKPNLKPKPTLGVKSSKNLNYPSVSNITGSPSSTKSPQDSTVSSTIRTPPPKPTLPPQWKRATPPLSAGSRSSGELNLDDVVNAQMSLAKQQSPAIIGGKTGGQSEVDGLFKLPSRVSKEPNKQSLHRGGGPNYEPLRELQVGQSAFYGNSEGPRNNYTAPKLDKRSRQPNVPRTLDSSAGNVKPLGPRPVPRRRAPPRPMSKPQPRVTPEPQQSRQARGSSSGRVEDSSGATQDGNLMQFSPGSPPHVTDGLAGPGPEEAENAELIADLENRLEEIDKDLQKYSKSCDELGQMLTVVDEGEKSEIIDNLQFYKANIEGLSLEKEELKANLFSLSPSRAQQEANGQKLLADKLAREKQEEEDRLEAERRHQEAMLSRHDTRVAVIKELIDTETDYLRAMQICMNTFLSVEQHKNVEVDVELLLGNIDEVSDLSQRLLTLLEGSTNGKEFDEQVIGSCFTNLKEDMKKVYAPYCRNHDEVQAMLEKYDDNTDIQDYLNRLVEEMKEQMSVFDLGAVLIKPVQRILKYPLLLNELLKSTEDDHPDKVHLAASLTAMTDVATAINEYKRRKDLVLKYKKESDSTFSDKFAKLTVHSTKKKFIRISQRMVGVQTVDEEFDKIERKFNYLDRAVRVLNRDVTLYMEQLQDSVSCQETVANDISDFYGDKSTEAEVQQFCSVHNKIASHIIEHFNTELTERVILPLNRLSQLFQGPFKVIKKRYDKLLDYDSLQSKSKGLRDQEQIKTVEKELQAAKNNYEALNAQLLDELPQLYDLSTCVLRDCISCFVNAQKHFYHHSLDEIYQLLGLQFVLDESSSSVLDAFTFAHEAAVERLSGLCFANKAFNSRLEDRKGSVRGKRMSTDVGRQPLLSDADSCSSSQSDSQRVYLRQCYTSDRLYSVTQDQTSAMMMDLSVKKGYIVGILKEGDPMGNKERWFVDTGSEKGFVSKRILTPLDCSVDGATLDHPPRNSLSPIPTSGDLLELSPPLSPALKSPLPAQDYNVPPAGMPLAGYNVQSSVMPPTGIQPVPVTRRTISPTTVEVDLKRRSISPNPTPPVSPRQSDNKMIYQAVYSFVARTEIEVSIQDGELVKVLETHDLDGNKEWWLVENIQRAQGYVPANYLYAVK